MRYERKYKLHDFAIERVLYLLKTHPAGFRKIYPNRQINNVYFDTPYLTAFNDNVAGIAVRNKVRLRWYGEDTLNMLNARLEIKHKNNELGSKTVLPFGTCHIGELRQISPKVNRLCHTHTSLRPVLLNSYRRQYYATPNRIFRITIDYNLRYHSLLANPHFYCYCLRDTALVVELKYEKNADGLSDFITQYLPFRQTKSSKYVTGVELTNA